MNDAVIVRDGVRCAGDTWRVAVDGAWRTVCRYGEQLTGRISNVYRKMNVHGCARQPWHTVPVSYAPGQLHSSRSLWDRGDAACARSGVRGRPVCHGQAGRSAGSPCRAGLRSDAVIMREEARCAATPRPGGGAWRTFNKNRKPRRAACRGTGSRPGPGRTCSDRWGDLGGRTLPERTANNPPLPVAPSILARGGKYLSSVKPA